LPERIDEQAILASRTRGLYNGGLVIVPATDYRKRPAECVLWGVVA